MPTSHLRRTAMLASAAAVAASGLVFAAAPSGAAPAQSSAPAAKVISSGVLSISVVPKSTTVWGLGYQETASATTYFGAERVGGGHFKKVAIESAGSQASYNYLVAGGAKSVFIIGDADNGFSDSPVVERSTGGAFKKVAIPKGVTSIYSAAGSSATNVVMEVDVTAEVGGETQVSTALMRWTGHSFHLTSIPAALLAEGSLSALTTSGPTSTWLLQSTTAGTRAVHFNGHSFGTTPIIKVPTGAGVSYLAAGSSSSVWAMGSDDVMKGSTYRQYTQTYHLVHGKWKSVSVPSLDYETIGDSLGAAGSHAFIAGETYPSKQTSKGLTEHAFILTFRGGKWVKVSDVERGVTSSMSDISVSSKAADGLGVSYNGYICGSDQNVKSTVYIASVLSTRASLAVAPAVRTASSGGFAPAEANRPAC